MAAEAADVTANSNREEGTGMRTLRRRKSSLTVVVGLRDAKVVAGAEGKARVGNRPEKMT